MVNPMKTILFATNLNENCWTAFETAASLASLYQATLVLLHTIEMMPDNIRARLRALLGEEQWAEMIQQPAHSARDALIAKKPSNKLIKEALGQLCINSEIDNKNKGYFSREIVVTDGEIVSDIINQANKYKADLIVLGSRQGFLSDNRIGTTIKSVMRKSKIPVLVVPPEA